ncbi:MAG: VanZ family protein [Erysipelotrichaceae bacterium]|nr:VanZ family protein [Erysipelotrichaceae bacterium]
MKKAIKAILLILWMALIFYMSAQPQMESEATSNLATELIYKVYHFLTASSGMEIEEFFARYGQFIRKLAHFTEFMILGILIKVNYEGYSKDHTFLLPLLYAVAYAASDEFHQLFVQGRYCSFKDVLIDSSGAFLGILICRLIKKRWKRKENV